MNVNLWFARDNHNEITTILNSNNEDTYTCPICNSEVIPKALESKQVTPHFAHIDRNKCTGESYIHFWMKHGFIERGDTFTITSDEKHTFTCKDFKTEVTFNLDSGVYRPDIVVETECGNDIVFEMAHKNKKKVQDYIDRWIELDKIVVEVDTPTLTGQNEVREFKALYYNGKCFNFNKRDGGYYNTIGKFKEEMKQNNNYDIELVKKLDWLWEYLYGYNMAVIKDNKELYIVLDSLDDNVLKFIYPLFKKHKLKSVYWDYMKQFKLNKYKEIRDKVKIFLYSTNCEIHFSEYDKDYFDRSTININVIFSNLTTSLYKLDLRDLDSSLYKIEKDVGDKNFQIRKEHLEEIARNNDILKTVIIDLDLKYKKINSCYSFYNRFIFSYYVKFEYDRNTILDFLLPDEIVISDNYNDIYVYLDTVVQEYLINVKPFEYLTDYFDILDCIKDKYENKKLFLTKECVQVKVGKRKYIDKYSTKEYTLNISFNLIALDMIKINIQLLNSIYGHEKNLQLALFGGSIYKFNNGDYLAITKNEVKELYTYKSTTELFKSLSLEINKLIQSKMNSCFNCNKKESMSYGEMDYFIAKNLVLPKKCKDCRNQSKRKGV